MITEEKLLILSSFAYFTPNFKDKDFEKYYTFQDDIYYSTNATFLNTCGKVFEEGFSNDIFKVHDKCKRSSKKRALYKNLDKVKNYKIIAYKKSKDGYEGYAFLSEHGQLIFVAKGTKITNFKDIITDIKIVFTNDIAKLSQFKTHLSFVEYIIKKISYEGKIYFAGHSLGGGLAQYAIYEKIEDLKKAECITFNAVGIYQDLYNSCVKYKRLNDKNFKIVDYSFNYDIIGSFGVDVGESKYLDSFITFNLLEYHSVYNFYDFIGEDGNFDDFGKPIVSKLKPLRWYINCKLKRAYENRKVDKTELVLTEENEIILSRNDCKVKSRKLN